MREPDGEQQRAERAGEVLDRLARLEAELRDQRTEIVALREQMQRTQSVAAQSGAAHSIAAQSVPAAGQASSGEYGLRPRKPVDAFAEPQPVATVQAPHEQVAAAMDAAVVSAETDVKPAPRLFADLQSTVEAKPGPHRSLENRIGSQLFARVGVVALLIGVAWFLKLAIDNHWIHFTPIGRVASGLLVGAGIVVWSERFRRKGYGAFSYSLKAVGTGTLYLSLWASFHLYHLLPAGVALAAMVAVTAWNAVMAWAQDAELLAVYALAGGFATPVLLGTGGNHEVFLFSYLLAMDVAVVALLAKKPWQRLLLGAFPATVTYFIGWYSKFFRAEDAGLTAMFVALLSAPFVAVALVGRQREEAGEGVLMPLAAATFWALALYSVLEDSGHHAWLPWAAVALAAVYLLLMRVRRGVVAEAMHLAIAVVLLTVAIPLKAEGRWLTVGWLAEGVVLLWVAARLLGPEVQPLVRALMRWLGCGALALGVGDSLLYWVGQSAANAFWNARFATEMFAVLALAAAAWLARNPRESDGGDAGRFPGWPTIALLATLGAHLVTPLAVAREISQYWSGPGAGGAAYRSQLSVMSEAAFVMLYGAGLVAWSVVTLRTREATEPSTMMRVLGCAYMALGWLTMIVTPGFGDASPVTIFWNLRLLLELVGAAALAVTAWLAWRARRTGTKDAGPLMTTAACGLAGFNLLVLVAGVREIATYFNGAAAGATVGASADAGFAEAFSISAWLMVYAAALLAAGFWRRMAFVRWQGLGLLVFTIGKVFLYDMRNLSAGYRVLSFIGLGALLMTVSFAYQKDWLGLREDPHGEVKP